VDARLGLQHGGESGVARQAGQDALDGHQLLEALFAERPTPEDLRHAADRDAIEELVLTDSGHDSGRGGRFRTSAGEPVSLPP
jgi:hypothetical protein